MHQNLLRALYVRSHFIPLALSSFRDEETEALSGTPVVAGLYWVTASRSTVEHFLAISGRVGTASKITSNCVSFLQRGKKCI